MTKENQVNALFHELTKYCGLVYDENALITPIQSQGFNNIMCTTSPVANTMKTIRFTKEDTTYIFDIWLDVEQDTVALLGGIGYKNSMYGIW